MTPCTEVISTPIGYFTRNLRRKYTSTWQREGELISFPARNGVYFFSATMPWTVSQASRLHQHSVPVLNDLAIFSDCASCSCTLKYDGEGWLLQLDMSQRSQGPPECDEGEQAFAEGLIHAVGCISVRTNSTVVSQFWPRNYWLSHPVLRDGNSFED